MPFCGPENARPPVKNSSAVAFFYARHANSALDPLAAKLHDEFDVATHRTKLDRETGR